jgi:hypothetical protein
MTAEMSDDERFEQAYSTLETTIRPNIGDQREPSRDKSGTVNGEFILADVAGIEIAAFRFRESESAMDILRPRLPPEKVVRAVDMGLPRLPEKKRKRSS